MAFNIVSTIINLIAPSVIDKVAAALGVNSGIARAALTAAVPAILGAFGNKASTDVGARALFDAVSKTDTSLIGDLASTLTGAGGERFLKGGLGSLTSLLGDSTLKSLTGAVAKQAGIGGDASSSIVSLAGQLAMGQLAKTVASDGLDASGLAGMLRSQQSNIKAALPAGFGDFNIADTAARATQAASRVVQPEKKGINWLTWLIPLLLALAALWYFLGNTNKTAVVTDAATSAASAVKDVVIDGVDVGKQVTSVFDGLKTTLGGITDTATAQSALPKLEEAVKTVDGFSTGVLTKLSAEQKSWLAALVTAALPSLKDLVAKVLAIPGVGDVVKPTLDGLMTKLEALAKA